MFFKATEKSPEIKSNTTELLLKAVRPNSRDSSQAALKLLEELSADQLNMPHELDLKMAFTTCSLDDDVKHTVGTQCLIYLFDPGNGWTRDCFKRGDMLLMTARLVEKGANLEGLFYYRNNPLISDQAIKQTVQRLIDRREGKPTPSAILNDEIIKIFKEAGYDFNYPPEFQTGSFNPGGS